MEMQNSIVKTRVSQGDVDGGADFDYSRILRVVGQELETKGISTCCLWMEKNRVDVIGLCTSSANGVVEAGFWQRLKSRNVAAGYTTIKLGYSIAGLMRLDELNRAKRTLATPRADFLKLSEQLRTVGAIVDRRGGQLIRLDRTAYEGMISSFTVQYKMATGELVTEEFSAPSLYDFSVQIFMLEKRRSGNSPAVSRAA
ncbi:MAG: hypothetical protein ACXWYD_18735 [Candidatus Binatia bacterium]